MASYIFVQARRGRSERLIFAEAGAVAIISGSIFGVLSWARPYIDAYGKFMSEWMMTDSPAHLPVGLAALIVSLLISGWCLSQFPSPKASPSHRESQKLSGDWENLLVATGGVGIVITFFTQIAAGVPCIMTGITEGLIMASLSALQSGKNALLPPLRRDYILKRCSSFPVVIF